MNAASPQDAAPAPAPQQAWWRELDRGMWWVLFVAALGWLFDVMDQRIFSLSRNAALDELLSVEIDEAALARGMTAAEAARLLGVPAGAAPDAPIAVKEADGPRERAVLLLPPLEPGGASRAFPVVRPRGGSKVCVIAPRERNDKIGRVATAVFMAGWATGGLLFGILGDKLGRVLTMVITILVYSLFTGLSALSVSWIDYSIYRFLTGLGVGGEFAAGAALVAEVMPPRARPYALGFLQSLSALGNIIGSLLGRVVLPAADPGSEWAHWRLLYLAGIVPALLVVLIRWRLKEPASWQAAKHSAGALIGKQLGAFGDLFEPRWRRSTVAGLLVAASGVIGLWGVGFWTPELIKLVASPAEYSKISSYAFALQDVGAFFGIAAITLFTQGAPRARAPVYAVALLTALGGAAILFLRGAGGDADGVTALFGVTLALSSYSLLGLLGSLSGGFGRRTSFVVSFLTALAATCLVFGCLESVGQAYWMTPVLGFWSLTCFGLYAIYFPELYPTRLRATGTGFCYNVARYIAAGGLFFLAYLGEHIGFRASALAFATVYLVGVVAVQFAPETKDRPLPEG